MNLNFINISILNFPLSVLLPQFSIQVQIILEKLSLTIVKLPLQIYLSIYIFTYIIYKHINYHDILLGHRKLNKMCYEDGIFKNF